MYLDVVSSQGSLCLDFVIYTFICKVKYSVLSYGHIIFLNKVGKVSHALVYNLILTPFLLQTAFNQPVKTYVHP